MKSTACMIFLIREHPKICTAMEQALRCVRFERYRRELPPSELKAGQQAGKMEKVSQGETSHPRCSGG